MKLTTDDITRAKIEANVTALKLNPLNKEIKIVKAAISTKKENNDEKMYLKKTFVNSNRVRITSNATTDFHPNKSLQCQQQQIGILSLLPQVTYSSQIHTVHLPRLRVLATMT